MPHITDGSRPRVRRTLGFVRRARLADAPELERLFARFFASHRRGEQTGLTRPSMTAEVLRKEGFGAVARIRIVVADTTHERNENTLAGYAIWTPVYETDVAAIGGYLTDLYVEPSFRKSGIGSGLLRASCRWVSEEGGQFLFWHSSTANKLSRQFYETVGERVGDDVVYIAAGPKFSALLAAEPIADDPLSQI